jgi:hypothetical protein
MKLSELRVLKKEERNSATASGPTVKPTDQGQKG